MFKKGHIVSEETRRMISKNRKGKLLGNTNGFKNGQIPWNKGLDVRTNTGKTHFKKGQMPWNKGFKKRLNTGRTHFRKGSVPHNWKGGMSGKNLLLKREKLVGRKRPEQCEVCGAMGRICFDHDHKTGKFRGWICLRCNSVLGLSADNSELLLSLADYLRKNNYDNK